MKQLLSLSFFVNVFFTAVAQPADAVIRKDLTDANTIEIKFTKSTGTRQWNSSTGNWEYVRGVNIRRKTKEYPELVVKVVGDAVYQYTGANKYSYWKFRTGYNEWEGIPNPTEAEIEKMIATDWKTFYGYNFRKIVKLNSGPVLIKEKNFTWNNPNMVLFYMNVNVDMIASNTTVQTADLIYEVRLDRSNYKDPWKRFLSSCLFNQTKVISTQSITEGKRRELELKSLEYTLAEKMAQKELADLPELDVPDFKTEIEMVGFFHNILRNGNPAQLKVSMLKTLSSVMMVEGSRTQFTPGGKKMYDIIVKEAFMGDLKYKDQYCQNYPVSKSSPHSIASFVPNNRSIIETKLEKVGFKEGAPVMKLVLYQMIISVMQDQETVNYLNSFSDRKKLCPTD